MPPFAWLAKRAAHRELRDGRWSRLDTVTHSTGNIEMNILGISAHYHDSAAALVVDGVPVCAIQRSAYHGIKAMLPFRYWR